MKPSDKQNRQGALLPLTVELKEYKEKTIHHLLENLPRLETRLAQETRPEIIHSVRGQIEDMETHLERLQLELVQGGVVEPVADDLCKTIADALVKEKFFMAKKYVGKLETIEPFYPGLDRLRDDVENRRSSRKIRAIAQGSALPYGAATFAGGAIIETPSRRMFPVERSVVSPQPEKQGRFSGLFQFHILASCLVVLLILCVMLGVGGTTVLQWLIQGG